MFNLQTKSLFILKQNSQNYYFYLAKTMTMSLVSFFMLSKKKFFILLMIISKHFVVFKSLSLFTFCQLSFCCYCTLNKIRISIVFHPQKKFFCFDLLSVNKVRKQKFPEIFRCNTVEDCIFRFCLNQEMKRSYIIK